jgi:hypothetical protein
MVYALAFLWIAVTVLTTLSVTAIMNSSDTEVFAQGNNTMGMMEYDGNMTSATNATSTDSGENATADDAGSISRAVKA